MMKRLFLLGAAILMMAACNNSDPVNPIDVCNGEAISQLPIYDRSVAGPHPYFMYEKIGEEEDFDPAQISGDNPIAPYVAQSPAAVELVICVTTESVAEQFDCNYTNDEGERRTVTYSVAASTVEIYEAQNGRLVDSRNFGPVSWPPDFECPEYNDAINGRQIAPVLNTQQVSDFLETYVNIDPQRATPTTPLPQGP